MLNLAQMEMELISKKKAGRLLDGRTWDQMPAVMLASRIKIDLGGPMKKENKTIAVTLRFWTNDLKVTKPDSGSSPFSCWDSGMAILEKNTKKNIPHMVQPFNCPEDIFPLIKEMFRKAGVVIVSDNRRPRVLSPRRKTN